MYSQHGDGDTHETLLLLCASELAQLYAIIAADKVGIPQADSIVVHAPAAPAADFVTAVLSFLCRCCWCYCCCSSIIAAAAASIALLEIPEIAASAFHPLVLSLTYIKCCCCSDQGEHTMLRLSSKQRRGLLLLSLWSLKGHMH